MSTSPIVNVPILRADMAAAGMLAIDLAKKSRVAYVTVCRTLRGQRSNPRTVAKLAKALKHKPERYFQ